jgi:hypothetical protein
VEGEILLLVERAVDVILALALVPARLEPGGFHVDRLEMDDRRDRVEKGERLRACRSANACGKAGGSERTRGYDREPLVREGIDPLAHERDVGMRCQRCGDPCGKSVAIDRECRSRRHLVDIALPQDQRAERAHLGMEQPDGVAGRVI